MLFCGLKLTHDGTVAVVDRDELRFSFEAEKLDNRPRYSALDDLGEIDRLIRLGGVEPADITMVAIDGWGTEAAELAVVDGTGSPRGLVIAGYADSGELDLGTTPGRSVAGRLELGGARLPYRSHPHTLGHVFSAYCTSPFARDGQPALVVVWDGGTGARLYHLDPGRRLLRNLGFVLETHGNVYPIFASFLEPFARMIDWPRALEALPPGADLGGGDGPDWLPLLTIPGKAMAYAGLGELSEEGVEVFRRNSREGIAQPSPLVWTAMCRRELRRAGLTDASMMATFQEFLYRELAAGLEKAVSALGAPSAWPLCFAGGCALNIKFNARLRASGQFQEVWVPPFPNDSGSAVGAACQEMVRAGLGPALRWSVQAGPALLSEPAPDGWTAEHCTVDQLAAILHGEGQPVVVLSGRAELGPRALGHRSILAPATSPTMRAHLNDIKGREPYRPVAPICLVEQASEVFDPGSPDPYMLFDHRVRPEWLARVPAIVHADGTARLQTVGPEHGLPYAILEAYRKLSGVPLLCNTSANLSGCGFFPSAASAMRWGRTRRVWADGVLFTDTRS